ncbi:MAG: laccase domain-containing protein [Actinomycetales bacterium]|nr:laccase domain-containing protein [Actinomycetales bacterium]
MIQSLFASRNFKTVSVVVTNRLGGVSLPPFAQLNLAEHVGDELAAVTSNRQLLTKYLTASEAKFISAVHGNQVQVVDLHTEVKPGDGLVSTATNTALIALAADCATFALIDEVAGVIAVGHCGWQGLAAQLPKMLIGTFEQQGARPASSVAVVGPTICGSCYQVPAERVSAVHAVCPAAVQDENHLDIARGVTSVLTAHGIEVENLGSCTVENSQLYSYRRDGVTGRHALAVIRRGSED